MKEEKQERLFRAIGDVGGDLIDMAEKRTFAPSAWRKWGALAACLAVILCLGTLALPYFPMGCGSSQASAPADTSASTTADMAEAETAVEEAPAAAGEPAEEPEAAEEPAEEYGNYEDGAAAQPQVRAQLTFRNTVYYVEALYSEAEGEAARGEYLGVVEDGDKKAWTGCPVYSCHSYDKDQTEAPVDILVQVEDGYLYCVTYQLRAGAPFDIVDTLYLLEHGGEETVAKRYAAVFEAADFTFDDPAELSEDRLTAFFLLTLQMEREAGIRTEDLDKYLWYDEQNDCYAVPAEDVKRQLDRYLEGYRYESTEPLVLEDLSVPVWDEPLNLYTWACASGVLTLNVEHTEGDVVFVKVYTIEFTEDACWYRSIVPYSE